MIVKNSDKPNKKLMAVFTKDNGRTKKTHFGAKGMDDYTITKDKEQRSRYKPVSLPNLTLPTTTPVQ